jgi:hypothetical protein
MNLKSIIFYLVLVLTHTSQVYALSASDLEACNPEKNPATQGLTELQMKTIRPCIKAIADKTSLLDLQSLSPGAMSKALAAGLRADLYFELNRMVLEDLRAKAEKMDPSLCGGKANSFDCWQALVQNYKVKSSVDLKYFLKSAIYFTKSTADTTPAATIKGIDSCLSVLEGLAVKDFHLAKVKKSNQEEYQNIEMRRREDAKEINRIVKETLSWIEAKNSELGVLMKSQKEYVIVYTGFDRRFQKLRGRIYKYN